MLVVDDELLIRWSVTQALEDRGFQVTQAESAAGALTAVRESPAPFEYALIDLKLPDSMDLTLLSALRRLSPGTSVVLMTAFDTPEIVHEAMALGAVRVLSKPFEISDVAAFFQDRSFRNPGSA